MRAVAKDEICRYFRTEIRRRERELAVFHKHPLCGSLDSGQSLNGLEDFLSMLTPQEHNFCREVLLAGPAAGGEISLSTANIWQLTHRVYEKLLHFMGRGT